jgi:hypothetical protein
MPYVLFPTDVHHYSYDSVQFEGRPSAARPNDSRV